MGFTAKMAIIGAIVFMAALRIESIDTAGMRYKPIVSILGFLGFMDFIIFSTIWIWSL